VNGSLQRPAEVAEVSSAHVAARLTRLMAEAARADADTAAHPAGAVLSPQLKEMQRLLAQAHEAVAPRQESVGPAPRPDEEHGRGPQ
jgi:hypothetical protein